MSRFGFDDRDFDRAIAQADAILAGVARRLGRITYTELAEQITALSLDMHAGNRDRAAIGEIIGDVSRKDHEDGRGLRSVLVVSGDKHGAFEPNEGFFVFAKELGYDVTDRPKFLIGQYRRVYRDWRT
jgi:hypothetical protein